MGDIKQPLLRLIWQRGRGFVFWLGEARYYGWRFALCVGPLTLLCSRACRMISRSARHDIP